MAPLVASQRVFVELLELLGGVTELLHVWPLELLEHGLPGGVTELLHTPALGPDQGQHCQPPAASREDPPVSIQETMPGYNCKRFE